MKMIPATCQCGEEFLREPHDNYPRCSECFFEHDAPALKKLTDEVTEERPGLPSRSARAATESTTHEGAEDMSQSIELSREDQANEAVNSLLQAATGLTLYELKSYLRNSTSLSSEDAWDRLGRGHDWTFHDIIELATLWEVMPSTLAEVIHAITEDVSAYDLVEEYELDRRPYIMTGGEAA